MKNPAPVYRLMFIAAMGFLLVGVLFSITGIPAAELFSILGGVAVLVFYFLFSKASVKPNRSAMARHFVVVSVVAGQILKSFDQAIGTYLFLIAFIFVLVWVVWSVLEELPPSEQ